mgnify:CR=1 FL=1
MSGTRRALLPLAFVSALAVVVATGCSSGGGTKTTPTTTPSASVSPTATASPSPSPTVTPTSTSAASVYFLKGEKLQPALRKVAGPSVGADAVRWLLVGPSPGERARGLTSTIPAGTTLNGLDIKAGLATVDLSKRFESGGGTLSMTARVAEVVFTLTQFPTANRVSFKLDGKPVTSLGGEGILLDKPQRRSDYEDLSPAVLVESPRWDEKVSSPLRVSGTANVFEGVFFVEVRDDRGKVLVSQRVMASSGTGTRGTFAVTVRASITDPGLGTLRTFVYSAKDGSRQDVSSTPLTLVP